MKRTYLALAAMALGAAVLQGPSLPPAQAVGLFDSRPVDASRFAVLARPVGRSDWSLLVLEQIRSQPLCWETRPDGLIDAALNRFDFTGICSRYIDSNGYSLRTANQDLGGSFRLRLRQVGEELQLQAMSPVETETIVVGRGRANRRDRDGFVAITLEPTWQLGRRVFGEQTLSHLYFANPTPMAELIAAAAPATRSGRQLIARRAAPTDDFGTDPIALPVVPFAE
ncbi:MAG: DUF3747 domain-containing protein [Cyanobacteria bacterium]|nr:DUF3747 domain-containing protein [Cyanobacteria bacterium bin.51]